MKNRILEGLHKLTEAEGDGPVASNDEEIKDKEGYNLSYDNIRSALDNELINHSAVIRGLWGSSDATNRSEFKKKLDMANSDSGSVYKFTEDEVGKIESILMTFRDDLGGELGKGENDKKEEE